MASPATWLRTVKHLRVRQVLARPSFHLRRRLLPRVSIEMGRRFMFGEVATLPSADSAGPNPITVDGADLDALAKNNLSLVGQMAPLPQKWPFEPESGDPLYRYAFHELTWLRAAVELPACGPDLRNTLTNWLVRYLGSELPFASVFWDPYTLGTRCLNLRALVATRLVAPELALRLFPRWTAVLLGLTETHLGGNHLLRNHTAAVVGAAYVGGRHGARLRNHLWQRLAAEVTAQFSDDGCHEERTPGYHLLAVWELLVVLASSIHERPDVPNSARQTVEDVVTRALAALEVMTHADGRLCASGDTAPLSLSPTVEITDWARTMGLTWSLQTEAFCDSWGRRTLADGGFSVLRCDPWRVHLQHGPFGIPHQPGHAHCDLFAFELDKGPMRVIVDPGVHAYHDAYWREQTRSASTHATPSLGNVEQAEIWSRFRCGWRPTIQDATWERGEQGWRFVGEAMAFGPDHPHLLRRQLEFCGDAVLVEDRVADANEFSVALTLAPSCRVRWQDIFCVIENDAIPLLRLSLTSGRMVEEAGYVSHRFGACEPASCIRLWCDVRGRLDWRLDLL